MSITTGLIGDDTINCYKALEVGQTLHNKIIGKTFGSVKMERKSKILSLRAVNSSIKINDDLITIDPLLIFQRISLNISNKEDMREYLKSELAPFPLSLFDENGMRKTQKSLFYTNFESIKDMPALENLVFIIDGGFLLHRVIWHQGDTVDDILKKYVDYIQKHYSKNSYVIFDGYPDILSTKSAERLRRAHKNIGREINFNRQTHITFPQEKILSNNNNKTKLIALLQDELDRNNIKHAQAEEDADLLIINTAIEASATANVKIVGEDIDLLVLLIQLAPQKQNIFFCKASRGAVPEEIYSTDSFKYSSLKHVIAFLHIFTGCDTTSCFFRQGKNKLIKIFSNSPDLVESCQIFYDPNANRAEVAACGNRIIARMYSNDKNITDLNDLRFLNFKKSSSRSSFKLENLPPTEGAGKQHSFRTFQQLQQWLGNDKAPYEWGWKRNEKGLQVVYSEEPLIPEKLLKVISCRCANSCKKNICGCLKKGLFCSNVCACSENCTNKERIFEEIDENLNAQENEIVDYMNSEILDCEDDGIEDSVHLDKRRKFE